MTSARSSFCGSTRGSLAKPEKRVDQAAQPGDLLGDDLGGVGEHLAKARIIAGVLGGELLHRS